MSTAWVLLTAMPPTKGHWGLLQFASRTADELHVVLCTQPGEPYPAERAAAVRAALASIPNAHLSHLHETLPQQPAEAADFWEMWRGILVALGLAPRRDLIVASERYGAQLASVTECEFIPFDIERAIFASRATDIRRDPRANFSLILPQFQPVIKQRVTLLGAESTGKTTLSHDLAEAIDAHWLPEWARPYLEGLPSPEVTIARMHAIVTGQRALQLHARDLFDRPFVVQDTDLFATIGFWQNWRPSDVPTSLIEDAACDASDLYLITPSNIAFQHDPLRYGGDYRETRDEYWIELADRFGLNYRLIQSSDRWERRAEATQLAIEHFDSTVSLAYERR